MNTNRETIAWHARLCDLLDGRALLLAFDPVSLGRAMDEEIHELARRLGRPHAGYTGMAALHSRRAGNHDDDQWVGLHRDAEAFYDRAARALLDSAEALARQISDSPPEEASSVAAWSAVEAGRLLADHGCSTSSDVVMLHLADACIARGVHEVAEVVAFQVISDNSNSATEGAMAAAARLRLAAVAADRGDQVLADAHLLRALEQAQRANYPIRWWVAVNVVEQAALSLARRAIEDGDEDAANVYVTAAMEAHRDQPLGR